MTIFRCGIKRVISHETGLGGSLKPIVKICVVGKTGAVSDLDCGGVVALFHQVLRFKGNPPLLPRESKNYHSLVENINNSI